MRGMARVPAALLAGLQSDRTEGPRSENAFAKLKALLRARAERTVDALWDTTGKLIDAFKPDECANYFKAAGYEWE